jgi:hypothetical protein
MIYVGQAEQFHIFHSMQHNSITIQTTVLEVQQYFKNHKLPCLGPYWSIISTYNNSKQLPLNILVCHMNSCWKFLVYNMYSGPYNAQYVGAACYYAGTVHGTGATMLGQIIVMMLQHKSVSFGRL